jgi:hypothetical protein
MVYAPVIDWMGDYGGAMDERELKQMFAELIEAQSAALGLVVAAMACQMDAERLVKDLKGQIDAAKLLKQIPPLALRMATHAMAAAEAETALRRKGKH